MEPYSIIGRTNEQYKTFNDEVKLRSFDNLIIIPNTLRALQQSHFNMKARVKVTGEFEPKIHCKSITAGNYRIMNMIGEH